MKSSLATERALLRWFLESLRPVLRGLSLFLFSVAAIHTLYRSMATENHLKLSALAFCSGIFLWVLAQKTSVRVSKVKSVHIIGLVSAVVVLVNAIAYLILSRNPYASLQVTLIILGAGCYFLSLPWLLATVACCWASWLLAVSLEGPDPLWPHLILFQIGASVLSLLIHTLRYQSFLDLIEVRQSAGRSEANLLALIENTQDFVWSVDPKLNFITANSSVKELFKKVLGQEVIEGANACEFLSAGQKAKWEERYARALKGERFKVEDHYEFSHGASDYDIAFNPIFSKEGVVQGVAVFGRDITDRKKVEAQLVHEAFHDPLTGLPNRALFTDRLAHAIRRAEREPLRRYAVLFLDVDRFKVVNDSLGHAAGDRLLLEVAERLKLCVRPGDTVARIGGDEFVILIEEVNSQEDATVVAHRIHKAFAKPFDILGEEVFSTASIGITLNRISTAPPAPLTVGANVAIQTPEEILRDADTAMYRAKAHGKARSEIFEQAMHTKALETLKMENDLRRAVDREEFRLFYQPIIDLRTLEIVSFEALIRWQHPHRGLLTPYDFIPIAEEVGIIVPVGRWVLAEACRQMSEWQRRFNGQCPKSISVNLSAKQLISQDLIDTIDECTHAAGISAESLRLEVTESLLIENKDIVSRLLKQLREKHIGLDLDDFGTGYSSLSYLHHLEFDALKIDRSFVSRITAEKPDIGIVETIVSLAKSMGTDVIAEGVETQEQVEQLKKLNCGFAQGFLFSRPLAAPEAELLLKRPPWK